MSKPDITTDEADDLFRESTAVTINKLVDAVTKLTATIVDLTTVVDRNKKDIAALKNRCTEMNDHEYLTKVVLGNLNMVEKEYMSPIERYICDTAVSLGMGEWEVISDEVTEFVRKTVEL